MIFFPKKNSPKTDEPALSNDQTDPIEKDTPLIQENQSPPPGEILDKKPAKSPLISKKFLIIFSIAFGLSALIAGGILTSRNALNKKTIPSPTPLVIASPIPSPEASPSATPEPEIILSNYKLLVLNGTGGKGVAGAVKDILESEGFENIKADNADKLDFTITQIQLKKTTPDQVFEIIDRTLNNAYEVTRSAEILTEDTDYDVIITVGETINIKE